MEQTFMTIHNLSHDANILFASDSVVDILGYQPQEVQGKSCFDYFHPDEVPFARLVHKRGVLLDKAAVLHYARILSKDGRWVSCECCFTIVHDVLVACTSIYRRGKKSERRAIEALQIRRLFSCSPRDPRYRMLEHLSPKFRMQPTEREPRAALILNRFTRTLTIMFATNAVSSILGVGPDELRGKSLYECIIDDCWRDVIKCLESAKANDSIAYLRFWSRRPGVEVDEGVLEIEDREDGTSENNFASGVRPNGVVDALSDDGLDSFAKRGVAGSQWRSQPTPVDKPSAQHDLCGTRTARVRIESVGNSRRPATLRGQRTRHREPTSARELEAVVSCTSDGLVMVLRKARPPIPSLRPPMLPMDCENGVFAAPWSEHSAHSGHQQEPYYTSRPPRQHHHMAVREYTQTVHGSPSEHLTKSIRDVAAFAWEPVKINGTLPAYGGGKPSREPQPPDSLPISDADSRRTSHFGPEPPSPKYQGDKPAKAGSLGSISPVHPHQIYGSPIGGGQGHTHTPSRFDNPCNNRLSVPLSSNASIVTHSPETRSYSHVQQQSQYPMTVYRNGVPRKQWAADILAEAPALYNQHGINKDRVPTTQVYGGTN